MKVSISIEKQFKSVSILPGIDLSYYYGIFSIAFIFLMWTLTINFTKRDQNV